MFAKFVVAKCTSKYAWEMGRSLGGNGERARLTFSVNMGRRLSGAIKRIDVVTTYNTNYERWLLEARAALSLNWRLEAGSRMKGYRPPFNHVKLVVHQHLSLVLSSLTTVRIKDVYSPF